MQVIAHLEPLQQRYSGIMADEGYLDGVLAQGAGRLLRLSCSACRALLLLLAEASLQTWRLSKTIGHCFVNPLQACVDWPAEKAEEAAGRTLENVRQVRS